MISDTTRAAINQNVDEYIDELRFDFIRLRHSRDIEELGLNKFVVRDTDLIIDRTAVSEEVLRHPIEDYFIPENVQLFVTGFIVELELPELINLADFEVSGILEDRSISIADPTITDQEIDSLIHQTCFDLGYQKNDPEVRKYLEDLYAQKHSEGALKVMARLKPFLVL